MVTLETANYYISIPSHFTPIVVHVKSEDVCFVKSVYVSFIQILPSLWG